MSEPPPLMSTAEELLTPGEVARMFRVDPKTVRKWGQLGRLTSVLTPGGHHRYRENEVRALLDHGRTTVHAAR